MNVNVLDREGQRLLTGKAMINIEYVVSGLSSDIWAVVADCLGTMLYPFTAHATSYMYIQAPVADGRDQDKST